MYLRNQCLSLRGIFDATLCDKVVSGMQQFDGYLWVLRFRLPIKLTITK